MTRLVHSSAVRTTFSTFVLFIAIGLAALALFPNQLRSAPNRPIKNTPTLNVATIPPAPQDPGPRIGYENFAAPGVLIPVTTTEAGQQVHSVEWMGRNSGEPSIGADWATGVTFFKSGLESLFVTFDDTCPANGVKATWAARNSPTSVGLDSDPIGFTDRGYTDLMGQMHSRTFGGELTFLSPDTVKLAYTDDDGMNWTPDQTGGLASAVDHESIGGGIYHSPIPARPPNTVYPYAVYYCSQDIAAALCSRSDNGGLTYGASVPIYELTQCGGTHGHIKVSPVDGTVYIPNQGCGGTQAVVVSQNNGITWTVRSTGIPSPSVPAADPGIGVDANGRVYFLGAANSTNAVVATSDDFGQTWQNVYDVGAPVGIKFAAFPTAVADDAGRAAVAFYGSTTGSGDPQAANFNGIWHLYISHTFDGGQHWTTTDATPNAPLQRNGLQQMGGSGITRNLADFFDITIDRDGRVLVSYVNGCEGGNCEQAADTATGNAYTTTATIARQSSGRRMLAAKDPTVTTTVPGMPSVTTRRIGRTVHVGWSEADNGNSPIKFNQIFRGTSSNGEGPQPIALATGNYGGSYEDLQATDITQTYYYKVVAVNLVGSSCPNNEAAAPYVGDGCTGIIIHKNDPSHPEANAGTNTPAAYLIDYIAVGEPADSPGNFMFKMKVNDLSTVPANSRWRITWNSFSSPGQQYYIGMTSGASGAPTFEYGTLGDAGVPGIFVIAETMTGTALPASNYQSDGTITIFAPKSAFGNPQPGDLLGAIGGRTFNTGDTPPQTLERSNTFIDHTFVKAQSDNSYPAATYTVLGNGNCEGGIVPLSAVSRKSHDSISTPFDINLPLSGSPGVECRRGQGTNFDQHQMVVTFAGPVTFSSANVNPGTGGSATVSNSLASGNQIFVNLSGVSNAQVLTVTLVGVNDGVSTSNVSIPMGVLLGDTNGDGFVNSADIGQTKAQSGTTTNASNFREDVNVDGFLNSADIGLVKSKSGTALP